MFLPFVVNKSSCLQQIKYDKIRQEQVKSTQSLFKPLINKRSVDLAKNHMECIQKEFEKNNLKFNHKELLIKKGQIYLEKK